jgi:hypothetical protein
MQQALERDLWQTCNEQSGSIKCFLETLSKFNFSRTRFHAKKKRSEVLIVKLHPQMKIRRHESGNSTISLHIACS